MKVDVLARMQQPPPVHVLFMQQGSPGPPQRAHEAPVVPGLPVHHVPASLQAIAGPGQQGWPALPQGVQR
jgi:hypothetical protein